MTQATHLFQIGRRPAVCTVATGFLLWLSLAVCTAQDELPATQHPWGRFPVGSWKSVRVVAETLDEAGNVVGITRTETKTTLVGLDQRSYSLRIESSVEVAGKRFASLPQIVKHGYYGEPAGQRLTVKKLGEEEIVLGGRKVSGEKREVTYENDGVQRQSKIHYSSSVWPYQLRRETVNLDVPDDKQQTTLVETVALDMPQKVLGQLRTAAYLKTTRRSPQGTSVTVEVHCGDVPGGVVSHAASECDPSGRVVRRSTLELIDFEIGGHPPTADPAMRRRMFHRQRPRRMD